MLKHFLHKFLTFNFFLLCNAIVFLAKLAFLSTSGFTSLLLEDYEIAKNIAQYGEYSHFIKVGPSAYKLPVYPLFLSFFIKLFPENAPNVIVYAQTVLYFFIPLLIIAILRLFNKTKTGVLAGYLFLFSPAYFFYSNVIEVTNIFIPLFLVWLYSYFTFFQGKFKKVHPVVFGFLTAVLLLTQVVVAPIVVVLLGYLLFSKTVIVKHWMVIILCAGLGYAPWVVRNYTVFHQIILTKTAFWQNVFLSYTLEANVLSNLKIIPISVQNSTYQKSAVLSEIELEKEYKAETEKALRGRKFLVWEKAVQNAVLLHYVPPRYFYDTSLKIVLGRKFYVLVLNILVAFSLFYFFRKDKKLFYFSLLMFIGFTFPYMIGHASNTRFKLDFEWYELVLVSLFLTSKFPRFVLQKES